MILGLVIGLAPLAVPASAVGAFDDDDGNVHEADIETIAAQGLAKGCNPPTNSRYCPDRPVTRGEMAAFLNRLLDLPSAQTDKFTDDNGSVFETDINAIAKADITSGCNPPANTSFCPSRVVTRGEMAAFLQRALDLEAAQGDYFDDDPASLFEGDINAVARVGISKGCNPPANTSFCPGEPVLRDQMATFLARALEIETTGTTSTTQPPSTTTTTSPNEPPPPPATGAFLEEDGVVVMEVESVPIASGWTEQTSVDGYTGSSYYYRTGAQTFDPGAGILTFDVQIDDPGFYAVSVRSRRDKASNENVENGERNDVFVKMDSDQWWKATTHAAFGEWGWIDKKTIAHATFQPLVWDLDEGSHTLLIAGRSQFVKIDRVHVYEVSEGMTLPQVRGLNPSITTPESPRAG